MKMNDLKQSLKYLTHNLRNHKNIVSVRQVFVDRFRKL